MFWLASILGLMAVSSLVVEDTADTPDSDAVAGDDDAELTLEPSAQVPDLLAASEVEETAIPTADEEPDQPLADQIVTGTDTNEILLGGSGDDQVNGYGGDDIVEGGAGDDILHGEDGFDTVRGGAGDDILHGEDGDDFLSGGSGQDSLFGHFGNDTLVGGAGDDVAEGGQDNDILLGGAGSDGLLGGYGDDQLDGGSGADTLFGGWGDDLIIGREADGINQSVDFLNGGGGSDTIVTGAGDIVTAGSEADTIILGDWIDAGAQAEIMDFDVAEDQLVLSLDLGDDPDPVIEIRPVDAQTGDVSLHVNGAEIALIHGGQGLTIEDITLINIDETPVLTLAAE